MLLEESVDMDVNVHQCQALGKHRFKHWDSVMDVGEHEDKQFSCNHNHDIPTLPITIDPSDLFAGATQVMQRLFPHWSPEELEFTECKDGITNKLVKVTHRSRQIDTHAHHIQTNGEVVKVLIRTYGTNTSLLIDRDRELKNLLRLHILDIGPKVYAKFENGIVYEFLEGSVCTVDDIRSPTVYPLIAQQVAKFHSLPLSPPSTAEPSSPQHPEQPEVFQTIERWISLLPDSHSSTPDQPDSTTKYTKSYLTRLLQELRQRCSEVDSPIVFCHNDLLSGNILQTGDSVTFIDYEYASTNPRAYDIANHFAEWAGFECDYSLLPSPETIKTWSECYLQAYNSILKRESPSANEVTRLVTEIKMFMPLPHLFWGVWSLLQQEYSDIEFGYREYAEKRIRECERCMSLW